VALLTFPPNPNNGDKYPVTPLPGQPQYQWSAADNTWKLLGVATGVIPGCYGDGLNVASFCVDEQGNLTFAGEVPIGVASGTVEVVAPPTTQTDSGAVNQVAMDSGYFYWFDGALWQRAVADPTVW